jgi:two-component system LytT family response regulator
MKALIVDDEPVARRRLGRLLERMSRVQVVGEAANGREALRQIEALRPDVVFLDIRMPGLDGLQVARQGRDLPAVVFTTAYDQYAVQAFETNAVDYLLKPIQPERLAEALERVSSRSAGNHAERLEKLVQQLLDRETAPPAAERISARQGNTVRVFDAREISRFHSADRYTVFRVKGEEYLLDDPLSALEARLSRLGFLRVHRAELINLERVQEMRMVDGAYEVVLSDGQVAPVSRRLVGELKRKLGLAGQG